jgi:uncharacterized RDD family membrane protein YckC
LQEELLDMTVDFEKEKKKNTRLAIGVASLGVVAFFVMYVLFFFLMIYSPWWFFNFFPIPSFSENVVGFKGNLFLFSKSVQFKGKDFENPPKEKMMLRTYDGKSLSEPQEIKDFSSLYPTEDKIYFFDKEFYRTFDGKNWEVFKYPAIGNNPKGAVGTEGMYVLSTVRKKPALKFVSGNEVKEVPFPDDETTEKIYVCSSKILCLKNELYLFYKNNDALFCYRYDEKTWSQPDRFENAGDYEAIAMKDKILLFQIWDFGKRQKINLRIYSNHSWSEPKALDVKGTSFNFTTTPAVFAERPILYQQGPFYERYYFVDGGQVSGPFKIGGPFFFTDLWKIILITIGSQAVFFILAFLLSFCIGKFKLKTWRMDSEEYEFASLWRRFLADGIDTLITTVPFTLPFYFALRENTFFDNPFRFLGLILCSMLVMLLAAYTYRSLLEGIWGKTLGKKICGIVVLKDDFTKCNIPRALLRNFLRIVDLFFYYLVAVVSIVGTMKWQRLGDIVAGTIVARDRRASHPSA